MPNGEELPSRISRVETEISGIKEQTSTLFEYREEIVSKLGKLYNRMDEYKIGVEVRMTNLEKNVQEIKDDSKELKNAVRNYLIFGIAAYVGATIILKIFHIG